METDKIVSAPIIKEKLSSLAFYMTSEMKRSDCGRFADKSMLLIVWREGLVGGDKKLGSCGGEGNVGDAGVDSFGGSSLERRKSCGGEEQQ